MYNGLGSGQGHFTIGYMECTDDNATGEHVDVKNEINVDIQHGMTRGNGGKSTLDVTWVDSSAARLFNLALKKKLRKYISTEKRSKQILASAYHLVFVARNKEVVREMFLKLDRESLQICIEINVKQT